MAQAPPLAGNDKKRVSQLLLAHGLQQLMPLPQPLTQRVRTDVEAAAASCCSTAMPLADGAGAALARLRRAVVRLRRRARSRSTRPSAWCARSATSPKLSQRDNAAEAAALDALRSWASASRRTPPLTAWPARCSWKARRTGCALPRASSTRLTDIGWHIQKSPKYRYDVVPVDDWYAEIDEPAPKQATPGSSWSWASSSTSKRVPLLPVLVQLIRSAPHDFNPEALAAHAEDDQMLATPARRHARGAAVGPHQAHPGDPGRAVFQRQDQEQGAPVHAGRGAPGRAGARRRLRWIGGERLRETGPQAEPVRARCKRSPPRPACRPPCATTRTTASPGCSSCASTGLAGMLADDMGLGKTVQTLAHILVEKEAGGLIEPGAGRLPRPA